MIRKLHQNKRNKIIQKSLYWKRIKRTFEFSLNVFTEFSDKMFCKKMLFEPATSCVRDKDDRSHISSKIQVKERIFKLIPIHASLIYQIPEFAEFLFKFGKALLIIPLAW